MGLTVSTVLQLLVVAGLAVAVLSLARQVSLLHRRLAPAQTSSDADALAVGDELEPLVLTTLDGHALPLAADERVSMTTLLFVAPDCPICRAVLPTFYGYAAPGLRRLVASADADLAPFAAYVEAQGLEAGSAVAADALSARLELHELPALVAIDGRNRLVAREVVTGPVALEQKLAQLASPRGENST